MVTDDSGREYIDCIAGYGNLNLGHNHPRMVEVMIRALQDARPQGWPFVSDAHAQLVERLATLTNGELDCSMLVNSGAEAVESAIKLTRLATGKPGVICARGAVASTSSGRSSCV